ncbi:PLD nuclease N-terminal domain-containing protein [Amphibacillus sp. Q70]|uniref:PLD nuclease N-terminal domain-containing protein n=1 Tax=Amphibacillus sp. Q70 TaxID=3453416 RepID=UPI003F832C53
MGEVANLFELLWPLLVLQLILIVIALIAWFKTDQTKGPKWLWLLIILFANIIGPILFFIIGRRTD